MAADARRVQGNARSRTDWYDEYIFQAQRSRCGHLRAIAENFVNYSG